MFRSDAYIREMVEKLAIQETIGLYAMCLNTRDWSHFRTLLTDDFVFTCSAPIERHFESAETMVRELSASDNYRHGYVFQMPHGVVVDRLEGDQARTRHTLHIMADRMNVAGIYYDALVRGADGVWRFARRDYHITYHDDVVAAGSLYRTFPDHGKPDWYYA